MKFILVGDGFPVVQTLELLLGYKQAEVLQVFTSSQEGKKSKVELMAEEAGISVHPSSFIKTQPGINLVQKIEFDYLININSTVIYPAEILAAPKSGAINMHPGLLPEYAGLHTHQWAIRNGESEAGATIHFITEKLDTGDLIKRIRIPISNTETGMSLFMKSIKAGSEGMQDVIEMILRGEDLPRKKQDLSRYRLYRHKDALNGEINWNQSASEIERFIRAGSYYPFESPTFEPYFSYGGEFFHVISSEIYSDSTLEPGQMTWDGDNLIVGCGNSSILKLTEIINPASRKKFTTEEMKEVFSSVKDLGVEL